MEKNEKSMQKEERIEICLMMFVLFMLLHIEKFAYLNDFMCDGMCRFAYYGLFVLCLIFASYSVAS